MQNKIPAPASAQPPPSQLNISDIYHVLFKHKWMILICSLAGFGAAVALYFLQPPPYESEAKLLVRYIQDSRSPVTSGTDAQVKPADLGGMTVMASEAEILSSLDVAAAVVDVIGADKILGKGAPTTNREYAALVLEKNLTVDVPPKGNVMHLIYRHSDPTIVQSVLRQVIDSYFKKHVEIHRNLGVLDEFLSQRTDQLKAKLSETEDALRALKTKSHVVSLEESRKFFSDENSKLRGDLMSAEVELEERQAALKEMLKANPSEADAAWLAGLTNLGKSAQAPNLVTNLQTAALMESSLTNLSGEKQISATNAVVQSTPVGTNAQSLAHLASTSTNSFPHEPTTATATNLGVAVQNKTAVMNLAISTTGAETNSPANVGVTNAATVAQSKLSPDLVSEYKRLVSLLDTFRKKEQDLLTQFNGNNSLVKEVRLSIDDLEKQKKGMESANPKLVEEEVKLAKTSNSESRESRAAKTGPDFATEKAQVIALAAKIRMLNSQLDRIRAESAGVDEVENSLVQLQRKKELEESQYRNYSTGLEQARVDTTLGNGKLSNISEIQSPSLPVKDSKKLKKKMGMAAGGGVGLGLGLAFLLELVLFQSIRRAGVLETKFHLPVFLTIPELTARQPRKLLSWKRNGATKNGAGHLNGVPLSTNGVGANSAIAPWDDHHQLHPYSEALRDRLASFFELKGMTHKPKLIALTSCSAGAGVTTIASGLAASLSETGEGNVLLVDMNVENGAAHPFFKGKPACGLADVLEPDKRIDAMVQDKLYVVNGGSSDDRLPRILPKRFAHLLPQLQASDYDYIIFDMPPVNQMSVTPRLAGFMDMIFLVVEAEKTSSDWVKQGSGMLLQSKANVGAIFNKRRTYVPRWLHQEF